MFNWLGGSSLVESVSESVVVDLEEFSQDRSRPIMVLIRDNGWEGFVNRGVVTEGCCWLNDGSLYRELVMTA